MYRYRLLIVDDEAMIVDYLAELLTEFDPSELEVSKAYSSIEAWELARKQQYDIVLTDIQMPGMTGIDLHARIARLWPRCKVIYLTGHDEFDWVREALRLRSADFLLKTEEDANILRAVRGAMDSLRGEFDRDALIRRAERQMRQSLSTLRKELALDLLRGDRRAAAERERRFAELEMPLDAGSPVLLALGRVDGWKDESEPVDRLILYAIENIAEELLAGSSASMCVAGDRFRLVWLVQPRPDESDEPADDRWRRTIAFAHGAFELIQETCHRLLDVRLSFALGAEPAPWPACGEKLEALNRLLYRDLGTGRQLLLIERGRPDDAGTDGRPPMSGQARARLKQWDRLREDLDAGRVDAFFESFRDIAAAADDPGASEQLKAQIYLSLASCLLGHMNEWGLAGSIGARFDLSRLLRYDVRSDWRECVRYLQSLGEALIEERRSGHRESERLVITRIKQYIRDHPDGDLSLATIADTVSLNPSYLSRLFKQMTGENLSEHIANLRIDLAKRLLAESDRKINEIAGRIGFALPQHFSRYFKKMTGWTPQEYRDAHRR